MRPAEGRQKVVKRNFVGHVDRGQTQTPLVLVIMKKIVVADSYIEDMSRRNAGRVVIIIFRALEPGMTLQSFDATSQGDARRRTGNSASPTYAIVGSE
jgi:hypothetical protein